jgi:small subunit ribosomal protein S6
MRKYELMYIMRPDLDEDTVKATREKVQATITEHGGEIEKVDDMGRRRLAYQIQKFKEGIYTVVYFQAAPKAVEELNHTLRINDNIMRHLVINLEEK